MFQFFLGFFTKMTGNFCWTYKNKENIVFLLYNFFKLKMAYIRIVDIDELNKLNIQNFPIWDNLGFRKLVCRRQNLKITNLNHLNFLKWKVYQSNNCMSWWAEQTWYSKRFNLRQFRVLKTSLYASKFKNHKFERSKLSQMESWPKQQLYILMSSTNLVFKTFQFEVI